MKTGKNTPNPQPFYKNPWLIGGSLAVLVTAGYFIFSPTGKPGGKTNSNPFDLDELVKQAGTGSNQVPPKGNGGKTPASNTGFPLRFNSKGTQVKRLQNALIKSYGSSILPRFGADGDWGKETQNALASRGWPTLYYSQSELNSTLSKHSVKIPPLSNSVFNAAQIARAIQQAINKRNYSSFTLTMDQLSQITSPAEYKLVSDQLKVLYSLGVRRNLVNALVGKSIPWPQAAKQKFHKELKRMGLIHDPLKDRWSLPALGFLRQASIGGTQVHSAISATVWDGNDSLYQIPAGLHLGTATREENGVTEFITTEGRTLYAQTNTLSVV